MANSAVRWDPFGDMLSLRQAMDHLFEEAWVRPAAALTSAGTSVLPVDLYETGDEVVVVASVPGVRSEDIEISVQADVLTIRGASPAAESADQVKYHRRERQGGQFVRQLVLPISVDSERAQARFEDGVLTLRLPKAEQAKLRRIPIQSG